MYSSTFAIDSKLASTTDAYFVNPGSSHGRSFVVIFPCFVVSAHTIRLHHIAAAPNMALLKECNSHVPSLL